MKIIATSIVLTFLLITVIPTRLDAQSRQSNESILVEMEKEFDQFRSENDLNTTKGWKWKARWIDFQTRRANPGGRMADPDIFMRAALNVSRQKMLANGQKASGNWTPVGPDFLYPSNFPDRQHGMGRINCMAFHPTDSSIFWVGVAQGGVWKTTDGGQNWLPLTDNLPILRISDIAVDPVNPDILYISVGDYAYIGVALDTDDRKRHTHYGMGVYKTTDGGLTWNPTGLTFNQTQLDVSLIRRVLIDPNNTQNLVAGGVTGIYRSTDAGANWSVINDSLIWDLIQDPSNPNTLYAASGYLSNRDIGTAGIIKSSDFGQTWSILNTSIPGKNAVQRIKLAISPQDPNYVYALACGMDRGFHSFYRSTDAGVTWIEQASSVTSPNILHWSSGTGSGGQGTYDLSLIVDANNKNRVYTGGINMWGSTDGGVTWKGASYWLGYYGPSIHADHHFYAYNPLNQAYYACHDGGLSKTYTIGLETWSNILSGSNWPTIWTDLSDMQITAFYRLDLSKNVSGFIAAGSQDNSTAYKSPSGWLNVIGGDGMDCAIDPSNPLVFYGSSQFGNFYRSDDGGQNFTYISNTPSSNDEGGWTTPILIDETNPNTIFLGYGELWQSPDKGNTWVPISTFPNMPNESVGPPISDFDIDFPNTNSIYVASRPYFSKNTLSKFWVSTDGGSNWNNRTNGLPDSLFITSVECGRGTNDNVYVALGGFKAGEKIYMANNHGISWTNISYNMPNIPINVIIHQENSPFNTLYAGTDIGVYYSNDTLGAWELFSTNLPNVIVSDLKIDYTQEKVYAATFGRGIWVSDLISSQPSTIESANLLNRSDIRVFPNPSDGKLTISWNEDSDKTIELQIVDIMGKICYREQIKLTGKELQLNLSEHLDYGLYFFNFNNGNARSVRKVIIEK